MSVNTWKRIITIFVVLIILTLLVTSIFLIRQNHKLSDAYKESLDNLAAATEMSEKNMIDLSEYDSLDPDQTRGILQLIDKASNSSDFSYQSKYPDLYAENDFKFASSEGKVCYLTFDDGPDAKVTSRILDTLKEYDVKATFFVIYKKGSEEKALYKRIVDEGHTIAIHTASHNYSKIYSSVGSYLKDFNRISNHIESVTGIKPEIFRFPGGSVNSYNYAIYPELISEMLRRGYVFYDWNTSAGDAAVSGVSAEEICANVLNESDYERKIVLLHDGNGHQATAEALPDIIEGLKSQGYSLEALTKDVKPVCFGYY